MDTYRYALDNAVWRDARESENPNQVVWNETVLHAEPDKTRLAGRFNIEPDLWAYFIETDTSFVSNESDAQLLLATRTARFNGNDIVFESLVISVDSGVFSTIESENSNIGKDTRAHWDTRNLAHAPDAWTVLAKFLDEFACSYRPVIDSIEDKVLDMEKQLADTSLSTHQLMILFRMRRQLTLLQRIVDPVSDLVGRLKAGESELSSEHPKDFRGALAELERLERRVGGLWQVVTSAVEMSNLLEQQRQGAASRKLTAWAGIVAVPTALAGIFGMNFERFPLFNAPNGHWTALILMAAISLGIFLRFKWIGWL